MAGKKPVSKARKPVKATAARVATRKETSARPAARKAVAARVTKVAKPEPKAAEKKVPVVASNIPRKSPAVARPAPKAVAAAPARSSIPTAPPETDEADAHDPGSLLAGPRNVKPYVAKRGERYMSKEQLLHFRDILLSWKRDLMVEVDRTVTHMKDEAANFPDPNDRATQEEEFSLELRTRDRERKLIRKIDEALKRTEDGSYGYCLETGEEIGIKRLEARPVATLSIEAQERRERRERQYGERDDRYR
jgi:DnaK suppressor protein